MAKHEAANMNLSKSMFELLNQFCYSAVPFLLENVIGLSLNRTLSYESLRNVNLVLTRICFLKEYTNAISSLSDTAILFVYWVAHRSSET